MSKTKKIAVLAVIAMVLTMLPVQLFAATTEGAATRLFGAGRVETALAVCADGWTSASTVIVAAADQDNLVDALAAAPLAGQESAPILITFKDSLDPAVKAKISALGATKVFVVGAVSDAVADEIDAISGVAVEKLKGSSRWDTAKAINAKLTSPAGCFVVGYAALADALSVSSFAAKNKYAIILADVNGNIPVAQTALGSKTYIVGGATLVKDIAGATRLAGADRFATNKVVLETLTFDYNKVYVTNGFNEHLVDSLVAAPLAAKTNAPIVLASGSAVAAADVVNVKLTTLSTIIALGGTGVVSDSVRDSVKYNTPATFAVTDITPLALDVFKVTFNQNIDKDSAQNIASYKVDGNALGAGSKAVLQSDNKTVMVTVDTTAYTQYQKVIVEVVGSRVYNVSKANSAGSFTKEITMSDTTVPTLESVTATGNKKITVKFSEPVDMGGLNASAWKLDSTNLSSAGLVQTTVKDVTTGPKTLSRTVDLYFGSAIAAGSHTVTVNDGVSAGILADTANFVFVKASKDFTVDAQTTAPVVNSVTCTNNTIYVEFDRAMYQDPLGTVVADNANADSALNINNYGVNNVAGAGATIATAAFKTNTGSKIVQIGANTGFIQVGTNVVELDKDLKDAWGNKLSSGTDNLRYSFTYAADYTKPTVTSVSCISTTKIRIQFSEKVNGIFATTVGNYKIKDTNAAEIFGSTAGGTAAMVAATATTDADTVELTMPAGTNLRGSGYTLTVENVRDVAISPNTMDKYTTTFDGTDDLGPTVANVYKKDAQNAVVRFSEKIDSATVIVDNFGYEAGNGELKTLPSGTTVTLDGTGKIVTVKFPTAYTVANAPGAASDGVGTDDKYDVIGIRVSNVKDTAGNLLQGVASTILITAVGAADRPSYVTNSFIMYDNGSDVKAEFQLNQEVSAFNVKDFAILGVNAAGAQTAYTADSGYTSGKTVYLNYVANAKLVKKAGKNAKLVTWDGVNVAPGGTQVVAGTPLTTTKNDGGVAPDGFPVIGYTVYDDQCKPKVDTITLATVGANAVVQIKFTEDIDATITGNYNDDFIFSSSGTAYHPTAPNSSGSAGVMASDVLAYTLCTIASMTESNVFVQAENDSTKIQIRDIKDAKEDYNTYVPSAGNKTGVNTTDALVPQLLSVAVNTVTGVTNDTVTLTFNEPVVAGTDTVLGDFAIQSPTGTPVAKGAGATITYSGSTITFDWDNDFSTNDTFSVTYTAPAAGLKDATGNLVATTTKTGVVGGAVADATAPSFAVTAGTGGNNDAVLDAGESMVITFTEAMTPTAITAANIDAVLTPSANSFVNGANIASAVWSAGNTVLTITFQAGGGAATFILATNTINPTALTDASAAHNAYAGGVKATPLI